MDQHRHRVLLTGAAGNVGSALREHFRGQFAFLRVTDLAGTSLSAEGADEVVFADLSQPDQLDGLCEGIDTVVHLAGIADEANFDDILHANIVAVHHLFEQARQSGVRRIVFASSVHAVGYYPRSVLVAPDMPVRPDTYYGLSKVFAEALGRMYWDKYGIEFVGVRIYSFADQPQNRRHLSTWLSARDAAQLFGKAVSTPDVGFLLLAGISDNAERWVSREGWKMLGYEPLDDGARYADQLPAEHPREGDPAEIYQGGVFTRAAYTDERRR